MRSLGPRPWRGRASRPGRADLRHASTVLAARRSVQGPSPTNSLPRLMTWEPELEELRRREQLARRMGGEERVARQHASGRLTVRERVERLLDEGSFHETGALAGRSAYGTGGELVDFLPANTVIGQGRVDGRRAVVQADDFTVRGGAADAAIWQKMVYAERMARPAPPAREARGRHRRRRERQDARADGLLICAAAAGLRSRRPQPRGRARGGRGARTGGGARRCACRVLALLGDRPRDGAAVRRRPAGRRDGRTR